MPIKGDMFAKVIQFLQGLGMVDKCEEEGWNDLSDKILQALREPFQFQPGRRTLDSRALPRPVANRVTKTKRKKGTTSVRRQLQSFARDLTAYQTPRPAHRSETQHETHGRDPQGRFPRTPTQCWASAPNDPGQWHLATNHQDNRLLSPQVSINDRGRDPLSDISLNAPNVYPSLSPPGSQVHGHCHADQGQRTRESISDTLRPERTGISTISALLNHDNNTPATAFAITQDSIQDSANNRIEPVSDVAGTENFRLQQWLLIIIRSAEFR